MSIGLNTYEINNRLNSTRFRKKKNHIVWFSLKTRKKKNTLHYLFHLLLGRFAFRHFTVFLSIRISLKYLIEYGLLYSIDYEYFQTVGSRKWLLKYRKSNKVFYVHVLTCFNFNLRIHEFVCSSNIYSFSVQLDPSIGDFVPFFIIIIIRQIEGFQSEFQYLTVFRNYSCHLSPVGHFGPCGALRTTMGFFPGTVPSCRTPYKVCDRTLWIITPKPTSRLISRCEFSSTLISRYSFSFFHLFLLRVRWFHDGSTYIPTNAF